MRGGYSHDAATTRAAGPARGGAVSALQRLKVHRSRIALAFIIVAGVAFAAGWNPPTTKVHSFTEASDYNAHRESGCTNSGDGCHGSDEHRRDFNAYHPETACKTCHEYTGVGCIPCHGPSQRECTGCHDGTMEGVSDCVRLSDPYPQGHYRESLHTAMGTDMTAIMRTAEGGEAKATCGDCHSRDLKAAHTGVPEVDGSDYGTDVGCAECHNDVQSGALEQVKTDWESHRCEDCHGEDVRAPMHAADFAPASVEGSGTAGCGDTGIGCHAGNKLHALHPNAPATCSGSAEEGEPGCHDLTVQAPRPTQNACGTGENTCHPAYLNTEYSHEKDGEVHSAANGRQGASTLTDPASGVTLTCAVCHSMDIGDEHTRPGSALGADSCLGCHNANENTAAVVKASWTERESAGACEACHGDERHGAMDSVHMAAELDRLTGEPVEGSCVTAGCHDTADVRGVHSSKGCMLAGCHSRTGSISGTGPMSCGGPAGTPGACHVGADKHRDFYAKHTGVELDRLTGEPKPGSCVTPGCHPTVSVYELHHDVGCAITGCHVAGGPSGIVSCGGPAGTPGACHVGADKHRNFYAKHTGIELDWITGEAIEGSCVTPGCHPTVSVYELHHDVGCAIAGCHVAGGPSGIVSCGGPGGATGACHTAAEAHLDLSARHTGVELEWLSGQPVPGSCVIAGCHPSVALDGLHADVGCTIDGCHDGVGPSGIVSCGGPDGPAGACHTTIDTHAGFATAHAGIELDRLSGEPLAGACARAGCHPTASVDEVHYAVGCTIDGCHSANGPGGSVTCGGPDTAEGACHTASTTHQDLSERHTGVELDLLTGDPVPGSCARGGCHPTASVYDLHYSIGCAIPGCHGSDGSMTCGGPEGTPGSCHAPPPAATCTLPEPGSTAWRARHSALAVAVPRPPVSDAEPTDDAGIAGEPVPMAEPAAEPTVSTAAVSAEAADETTSAHLIDEGATVACLSCHTLGHVDEEVPQDGMTDMNDEQGGE